MSTENDATARMAESIMRVQGAIRDRYVKATNAAADVLDALSDVIEAETEWPELNKTIVEAVTAVNTPVPRVYVCSNCFHKIEGPMILVQAMPTPRMVHWPECPTRDEPEPV